jgi:hypothetical protein
MTWRTARFGHVAESLATAVPDAVVAAHEDAMAAQRAGRAHTQDAYGHTLKARLLEVLAEQLLKLPGVVPCGMPGNSSIVLPVVASTSVALWPVRFGNGPSARHDIYRLDAPVSERRRALLAVHEQAAEQPMLDGMPADLDRALLTTRTFKRTVTIGFGSSPDRGVWGLGWGDMRLVNAATGDVQWRAWESLPVPVLVG